MKPKIPSKMIMAEVADGKPNEEKWIKEFDKKYYSKYILNGEKVCAYEMNVALLEDIKQFISTKIAEAEKKGYWEREKEIEEHKAIEEKEIEEHIAIEEAEEAHRTSEGYCCACGYDMSVMAEKIAEARKEEREKTWIKLNEWRDKMEKQEIPLADARKDKNSHGWWGYEEIVASIMSHLKFPN